MIIKNSCRFGLRVGVPKMSLSMKIKIARPYRAVRALHKKLDETLQVVALNGDIIGTILHNHDVEKVHIAIDHLQTDVTWVSRLFIIVRLTQFFHNLVTSRRRKQHNKQNGLALPMTLGVLTYLIFEDICLR